MHASRHHTRAPVSCQRSKASTVASAANARDRLREGLSWLFPDPLGLADRCVTPATRC
jgi:hypothetical protein